MSKIAPAVTAALLLFASVALAQTASVDVKDAWARATPAKAETGAAYLTLEAVTADRLTGVSTPVAAKAELHRMTMDGGIMRMRQLDAVDLPAGQAVTLQPNGIHIMLLGLKQPLHAGQSFPLTLQFANSGPREISVTVGGVGAMGPKPENGGGMTMPMHH